MLLLRGGKLKRWARICPFRQAHGDRSFKNDRAARTARLHTHLADLGDAEPLLVLQKSAVESAYAVIPNAPRHTSRRVHHRARRRRLSRFHDVALRDAIAKACDRPANVRGRAYITISEGAGAMTGLAPDIQLPWDLHFGEAKQSLGSPQSRQLAQSWRRSHQDSLTGAVLTHGSNPNRSSSRRRAAAAVDEARNFGLRVEPTRTRRGHQKPFAPGWPR